MNRERKIRSAVSLGILVAVCLCLYFLAGRPMIRFVSEPTMFRQWVDSHGYAGRAAFTGMVAFQVIVAVIPGEPFEIAAGYAFGAWEGTLYCLLGILLGSAVIFFLVHRWGIRAVRLFFEEKEIRELSFLRSGRQRRALFFLLYVLPGTPKDLLSYFVGLTDMPFSAWLLMAFLGRIPSVLTSALGGDALGTGNYPAAALTFVLTAALSLAGLLYYLRVRREENTNEKTNSQ